nr:MAG TPA: hypothetical protein [Caudoviricetes sp.]
MRSSGRYGRTSSTQGRSRSIGSCLPLSWRELTSTGLSLRSSSSCSQRRVMFRR